MLPNLLFTPKGKYFVSSLSSPKQDVIPNPTPARSYAWYGSTNRLELSFSRTEWWTLATTTEGQWIGWPFRWNCQTSASGSSNLTTQRAAGTCKESNVTSSSTILSPGWPGCSLSSLLSQKKSKEFKRLILKQSRPALLLGSRHVQDGHLCDQRPHAEGCKRLPGHASAVWDPDATSHINVVSNVITSLAKQLNRVAGESLNLQMLHDLSHHLWFLV